MRFRGSVQRYAHSSLQYRGSLGVSGVQLSLTAGSQLGGGGVQMSRQPPLPLPDAAHSAFSAVPGGHTPASSAGEHRSAAWQRTHA